MIAALLLLATTQAVPAFDGPPPPPPPGGPQRRGDGLADGYDSGSWDTALRAQGMSVAGIRALDAAGKSGHRDQRADNAALAAAARRIADLRAAEPFDKAAVIAALRARDVLVATQASARTARLTRALSVLSPRDGRVLLTLLGTGDAARGGPAGPGFPPGPPPGGFRGPPPGDVAGGPPAN